MDKYFYLQGKPVIINNNIDLYNSVRKRFLYVANLGKINVYVNLNIPQILIENSPRGNI